MNATFGVTVKSSTEPPILIPEHLIGAAQDEAAVWYKLRMERRGDSL
jgi:hypothetical protein